MEPIKIFKNYCNSTLLKAIEDPQEHIISQNIFIFKIPFVGTINLCLKMPDELQKTRNLSDHSELRKRPIPAKHLPKSNIAVFRQFLDVFSSRLRVAKRCTSTIYIAALLSSR